MQSRIVRQLLALSAVVLIVPWLGYESLRSMKQFLLEGQQQAQLQLAEGVAALLSASGALDEALPIIESTAVPLPVYPVSGHHVIDGYEDEWRGLSPFKLSFGYEDGTGFTLLLAQDGRSLYGLVNAQDDSLVVKHPGSRSLKRNDYLRFYLRDQKGELLRLALTFEGSGTAHAYRASRHWSEILKLGPETRIEAEVLTRPGGYDLEFVMPLSWIGSGKSFGVEQVDVRLSQDDESTKVATGNALGKGELNPLILRSTRIETLLGDLGMADSRLWLVDSRRQVRAIVGQLQAESPLYGDETSGQGNIIDLLLGFLVGIKAGPFEDFDASKIHQRNDGIYEQALAEGGGVVDVRRSLDGRAEIVTAAIPLTDSGLPRGVLLLEKSTRNILYLQRQSLGRLVLLTTLAVAVAAIILLIFALRLTFRIRRLGLEASSTVDEQGRFTTDTQISDRKSRDEIGDLARLMEMMLSRLQQHQQFLKNIPRILRHEINNPLNTIGTSVDRLENLPDTENYVESARRGLARINRVVNAITEAASLEEALRDDELGTLDLKSFLGMYLEHQNIAQVDGIALFLPSQPVVVNASGEFLEILLDKLIDNARDFSRQYRGDEPAITVVLRIQEFTAVIDVCNKGPMIGTEESARVFDFMHSRRDSGGEHFGLGLYVASVIADFHGGRLSCGNLADKSGVRFSLSLPLSD